MFAKFVGRRTLQRIFACEQLFVTFVTSGFAAHIGIIPQSLVSDGQKAKIRLVAPRALRPDRNFATWSSLPRLGSAPLTCYSVFTDVPSFQPMPLLKRAAPFDDPDWIYELKRDGFRALAIVEHGRAQLLSRNGHPFASFAELGKQIAAALPNVRAVIDGEICSLDRRGRPHFKNLLFRRGNPPCFFAFDLLTCDGKDLRTERLLDREQELRRLLAQSLWESKLHRD